VKLAEGTPWYMVQAAFEIMDAPRLLVIELEPHVSATLKPLPVIVTKVPTEPELGLSVIVATEAPAVTVKTEVEVTVAVVVAVLVVVDRIDVVYGIVNVLVVVAATVVYDVTVETTVVDELEVAPGTMK
jgi:hypothetical protein